jgi:hypothetical protein
VAAGCRYAEEKWSKNERALSQGCDFERAWSVVFLKGGGLSPTNLCRNEAITSDHRRRSPGLMAGRSERFLGGSLDGSVVKRRVRWLNAWSFLVAY